MTGCPRCAAWWPGVVAPGLAAFTYRLLFAWFGCAKAQQGFCAALRCCASGYKAKQPCLQLLLLLPQDPGPWDMEFALGALGLEGWEEVWDPAVDMRVLIGWGRGNGGPDGGGGRLVLAFRGTASFENVVTDLKVGGAGGHMGRGIG